MAANHRGCVNVCVNGWMRGLKLYSALDKGAIEMQSIYHFTIYLFLGARSWLTHAAVIENNGYATKY